MLMTLHNNRMSYIIEEQLDSETMNDVTALRGKWLTPEAKEKMIKATYNLPIRHAHHDGLAAHQDDQRTLGDLIENTDPEMVSTILLEEQLLETWHDGRTVLIGDACHKMNPSTGQGAVNAFQDAVVLVNCLYDLSGDEEKGPLSLEKISEAFKDYRDQRFSQAKFQLENANMIARVMNGQVISERTLEQETKMWYEWPTLSTMLSVANSFNFDPCLMT
jgi:2-polyprenyl-6-methoxyphenol hydroxylase-like FAD-dependent oxidoreductase